MNRPRPGDEVLIRGTVIRHQAGADTLVELRARTGPYEACVADDRIVEVLPGRLPEEPPSGTWLAADNVGAGPRVWVRRDPQAPVEPERRLPRRWWDVAGQQWVDWPTVVAAGADPDRALYVSRAVRQRATPPRRGHPPRLVGS